MAKQKKSPPQIVVRDGDQTIRKQLDKIESEWNKREGSVAVWDYSRIIRALVSREEQKITDEQGDDTMAHPNSPVRLQVTPIEFRYVAIGTTIQRRVRGYSERTWKKISDTEVESDFHIQEIEPSETVDAWIYVNE